MVSCRIFISESTT